MNSPELYEFGPFCARPAEAALERDGRPVPLSPKAFETLLALLRRSGRLVTKESLMETLWPDTFVEEGNLAFNVSVLRKALGEGPGQRFIETVPRRGYRFVGSVRTLSRPALATAPSLAALTVGREDERAQLRAVLTATRAGTGRLLCIAGEPGLGKTTLVESFLAESLGPAGGLLLRGRCSERLGGAEAYLPFLEALDDLMRGEAAEAADPVLRALAPSWHALTVRAGGGERVEAVSQERLKRELLAFLQDLARRSPVVLFIDDLQWADASTTDLLAYLGHRLDTLPLAVIVCYRPSEMVLGRHPFPRIRLDLQGRGLCHELSLGLLQLDEVHRYLDLAFPRHRFPAAFAGFIHAKTEGNPLFMVAVLRDLERQGVIGREGDGFVLGKPVPEIERDLPESVRGVIDRKIDQLDEAGRRLLAAASVQGYEFDSAVLASAAALSMEDVEERLEALERAHALVRRLAERELPDGTLSLRCRFVHVLYQNALYAGLSPTRRASLSLAVAERLMAHYGERAGEVAAELAVLFEAGRDFRRASEQFLHAARAALRVFAYPEAAALARRGLGLLERLPTGAERDGREVQLQTTLGVALMSLEGFAAPEVQRVYARALELSRALGPSPQLFPVIGGLWLFHVISAQLSTARELAEQIVAMARQAGQRVLLAQAHQTLGITLMDQGHLPDSLAQFGEALELYDPQRERQDALQYAFDPGVASRACAARVLVPLGRPDTALDRVQEAIALGRQLAHPPSLGFALVFGAIVRYLRGEPAEAEACATEAVALSREHGMAQWLGTGTFWQGWAIAETGDLPRGIGQMRGAIEAYRATGSRIAVAQFLGLLGDALRRQGDPATALGLLDEALTDCRRTGELYCEPELHLLRGRAMRDAGRACDAEQAFRQAVGAASGQSALWWQLKAAVEWHALAAADAARAAIAAALEGIDEGGPIPLVVQARAIVAAPH